MIPEEADKYRPVHLLKIGDQIRERLIRLRDQRLIHLKIQIPAVFLIDIDDLLRLQLPDPVISSVILHRDIENKSRFRLCLIDLDQLLIIPKIRHPVPDRPLTILKRADRQKLIKSELRIHNTSAPVLRIFRMHRDRVVALFL